MSKKQKHFSHQADIFDLIRKANAKKAELQAKLPMLEQAKKAYIASGQGQLAKDFEDDMKAIEKQIYRIENVRIKKLRLTLAAFQTEPMSFMGGNDVVLAKL